ncbi:MAG: glycosyltransferase family 4 protein [Bacteroidota bacterium]|nr:glycosyltransferase family 4 protein [Bacteroidota bacterium]
MKIAIIHDWLVVDAGAEKVLKEIINIWPNADIFSLIDFLNDEDRANILNGKRANTSFIQNLPFSKSKYRFYLPLFPLAIEQLDVSSYDVVICSSYAVAKGVLTHSNQLHICYCHSPIRYAWDLYFHYLDGANLKKGLKSWIARLTLHYIRSWDFVSSNRVDYFIANSQYISKRINKVYRRESIVVYPPVNVNDFEVFLQKEDFYVTISRLVPYKNTSLIVDAFNKMPEKILYVIGSGPLLKEIRNKANKNVKVLGQLPFNEMKSYLQRAKAFIFAADEDFGIVPVEAQACGTPVIAYRKGGVLESVIENETGVFFNEQNTNSLINAVVGFEKRENNFDPIIIRRNAEKFDKKVFSELFRSYVTNLMKNLP